MTNEKKLLNCISEINITIKGTGTQQILSSCPGCGHSSTDFNSLPNETLVNGISQSNIEKYVYNLEKETNIITMRWNYQLTDCTGMFYNLKNIISIDLSNFDSSQVTNFECMFHSCTSLKSINLNNINTSSVESMVGMFSSCSSLETLNLSSFDTSKVTSMWAMFCYCPSLKSLDLSNFDTLELTETRFMFYSCSSLVLLNIKNFNTSKVSLSACMFDGVNQNLIYCAEETKITNIKSLLSKYKNNCTHSCFLNQHYKYIIEKNECIDNCYNDQNYSYEYNNICYYSCPNGTHISSSNNYLCEDDLICEKYYNYDKSECLDEIPEGYYLNNSNLKTIDKCNIKCKNCSLESMETNSCISCNISAGYYPLYNNDSSNETFINCYNESIEGYVLDNYIYKPCFSSCKNCSEIGDENDHKCITCKSNYEFKEEMNNVHNCYKICNNYYYFDESNKYYCTETEECEGEYNKLIKEKRKCIDNCSKDNLYKLEYNNICYSNLTYPEISTIITIPPTSQLYETYQESTTLNIILDTNETEDRKTELSTYITNESTTLNNFINKCNVSEILNGLCKLDNKNNTDKGTKDIMILNIKELILKGGFDNILLNITKENSKGVVINDNNIVYQIVTTDNQINNKEDNISIIDLGDCETDLREHHHINKNDSLLIFKLDIYEEGLLAPRVEYEVYDSKTKKQLDLGICNDTKINILIPVIKEEDDINKYNSSSEYYNDICYTHTTDKGTDIILTDRKYEYNKNIESLCESKCEYEEYDTDIKKAKCECEVKIKIPLLSEITINSNILPENIDIKKALNVKIMKCYKVSLSKEGLKKNIGSYILLSIIFIVTICLIVFLSKGFSKLKNCINTIKSSQEIIKDTKTDSNNIIKDNKIHKHKKRKRHRKHANIKINVEYNSNVINYNNDNKTKLENNKVDSPPKKRIRRKEKLKENIKNLKTNGEETIRGKSYSILELNNKNNNKINEKSQQNNIETLNKVETKKNSKKRMININYNDYEINSLNYKEAIIIDKRNYFQYYLSLLRRKHIIIFTFFTSNDYNSKEIKICLFLFSFALYFTVNALFFGDKTMHKIYEDDGDFNFIYQIPQIIYSTIISSIINIIVNFLSLSEKNILSLKNDKRASNKKEIIYRLIIKFSLFYIFIYMLLILFWYYESCFCFVYKNTQYFLLKDTLISYGLSLIYPFGLCLIPGVFRIPALSSNKKNKKCLYQLSKLLQLI